MIRCRELVLLFLIFGLSPQASSQSKENVRSEVELQWEESPNASEYELQVLSEDGKLLKTLSSKTVNFKIRMPVNKYKIRGRFRTKLDNLSPWSQDVELIIPPAAVKIPSLKVTKTKTSPRTMTGKVELSWTNSPQAENYTVKIYSEDGKVVDEKVVDKNQISLELGPGVYTYSITANSATGISSAEVKGKEKIEVDAAVLEKPKFTKTENKSNPTLFDYTFQAPPGLRIQGELFYSAFLSDTWILLEKREALTDNTWKFDQALKPGKYRLKFWAAAQGSKNSLPLEEEFEIKPKEEDLQE